MKSSVGLLVVTATVMALGCSAIAGTYHVAATDFRHLDKVATAIADGDNAVPPAPDQQSVYDPQPAQGELPAQKVQLTTATFTCVEDFKGEAPYDFKREHYYKITPYVGGVRTNTLAGVKAYAKSTPDEPNEYYDITVSGNDPDNLYQDYGGGSYYGYDMDFGATPGEAEYVASFLIGAESHAEAYAYQGAWAVGQASMSIETTHIDLSLMHP